MSRDTPLHEVIKGLEVTDVTVGKLSRDRGNSHPDLYAKLLMACEGDQMMFLVHLYDEIVHDIDVKTMWVALIKAGFFVDMLDPKSPKARDLITAVQYGINTTKQRSHHGPHVCQKCKRLRR